MKTSAPVPTVSTIIPSSGSNELLFKFLGIFALILITLVVIFFATSRKRMENFHDKPIFNKECDQKQFENYKKLMFTHCDERLIPIRSQTTTEISSKLDKIKNLVSIFNDKSLDRSYDNFKKNIDSSLSTSFESKNCKEYTKQYNSQYKKCITDNMPPPLIPPPAKITPLPPPVSEGK